MSGLQQEVADTEAVSDTVLHLPVCNLEADKEEDVYPFNECILLWYCQSSPSLLSVTAEGPYLYCDLLSAIAINTFSLLLMYNLQMHCR